MIIFLAVVAIMMMIKRCRRNKCNTTFEQQYCICIIFIRSYPFGWFLHLASTVVDDHNGQGNDNTVDKKSDNNQRRRGISRLDLCCCDGCRCCWRSHLIFSMSPICLILVASCSNNGCVMLTAELRLNAWLGSA